MKIWKTTHHFAVGRDHYQNGLPCQDYVKVFKEEDLVVAAVSDGIGSLCNSHIASEVAVYAVIHWIRQHRQRLAEEENIGLMLRTELLDFIRQQILVVAEQRGLSLDTMDCNLAFASVFSNGEAVCGVIGDCAVCVVGENESTVMTCPSDSASATDTILGSTASECMRTAVFHPQQQQITGFLLTTDGLEGVIYTKNSRVLKQKAAEYMNTLLRPNAESELKKLIDNLPSSCDDDISVAIVSRAQTEITLPEDPTWLCKCGNRNTLDVSYCRYCRGDFVEMYKHVKISTDIPAWFLSINRNPDEERKLLGLPIQHRSPIRQEERAAQERPKVGLPADALAEDTLPFAGRPAPAAQKPENPRKEDPSPKKAPVRSEKSLNESSGKQKKRTKKAQDHDVADKLLLFFICLTVLLAVWNVVQSFKIGSLGDRIDQLEGYVQELHGIVQNGTEKVYTVGTNFLYLRTEPNGEKIESVSRGTTIYVIVGSECMDGEVEWVQARTESGVSGWCRTDQLLADVEGTTP